MDSPKMRLNIIKVFCCGLSGSWIRNFKSIYSKYDLDLEKNAVKRKNTTTSSFGIPFKCNCELGPTIMFLKARTNHNSIESDWTLCP